MKVKDHVTRPLATFLLEHTHEKLHRLSSYRGNTEHTDFAFPLPARRSICDGSGTQAVFPLSPKSILNVSYGDVLPRGTEFVRVGCTRF